MARVETFTYTVPGARKPDSIIVYPNRRDDGSLLFQGDRCIGTVDPITGKGLLYKGTPAYGIHLALAKPVTFPREFVNLVINYQPSHGDRIGGIGIVA